MTPTSLVVMLLLPLLIANWGIWTLYAHAPWIGATWAAAILALPLLLRHSGDPRWD
jgi:hypothetical protein